MLQSRNIKYFMCYRKPAVIIDNGRPTGKSNASKLPPNVSHLLRFVYKIWFQGNKQSIKLFLWECYRQMKFPRIRWSHSFYFTFGWIHFWKMGGFTRQKLFSKPSRMDISGVQWIHVCQQIPFFPLPGKTVPFQGYFKDKFHNSPCHFGQYHTPFA